MTPSLFLVDDLPVGDSFRLDGGEGRHAARVKRVRSGEQVLVSDGRGALLECEVSNTGGDGMSLIVISRRRIPAPQPRIVVVQALPKGERAELAVETLTEVGVDEIVPWAAERSIVRWDGERGAKALGRWRSTAREAGKQSRRAAFPVVTSVRSTREVTELVRAADASYVLHETATDPLALQAFPPRGTVVLIVGPEGGVTEAEVGAFLDAGAVAVRLGASVLRTSTAGAAAAAVVSAGTARWR